MRCTLSGSQPFSVNASSSALRNSGRRSVNRVSVRTPLGQVALTGGRLTLGISGGAQRRPRRAVVSALRVLEVRTLPKQRLEGLLVFFVVLKGVDIHGVVD